MVNRGLPGEQLARGPQQPASTSAAGVGLGHIGHREIGEYGGETYYFCAPGCKAGFVKAPAEYAGV